MVCRPASYPASSCSTMHHTRHHIVQQCITPCTIGHHTLHYRASHCTIASHGLRPRPSTYFRESPATAAGRYHAPGAIAPDNRRSRQEATPPRYQETSIILIIEGNQQICEAVYKGIHNSVRYTDYPIQQQGQIILGSLGEQCFTTESRAFGDSAEQRES